ncbi:hypothetical protein [Rubritalea sp.]|uniref:hypothetical protein n=1 Tax=Rubritalea sp. TaxID=2109375 RepID=UPI003241BFB5
MQKQRYTRDGSEALETMLASSCERIGEKVKEIVPDSQLEALILAGGYGRGEGGVFKENEQDLPYNDLEFFLYIKGSPRLNERKYHDAIHHLEHEMTEEVGIEVEFKISSLRALASSEVNMFYYDLLCGHQVTVGDDAVLAGSEFTHHEDASKIPLHEATRLMMNRFSGLLFAKDLLQHDKLSKEDTDFVTRNIAKAQLAIGDALLCAHGQYHWSCVQRHENLKTLSAADLPMQDILTHHLVAVDFKLHPQLSTVSKEELEARHREVSQLAWEVWRHIESRRLEYQISDPQSYSRAGDKCPETFALKNMLLRLRSFGPKGCLSGKVFRYPREILLNVLAVLLWQPSAANLNWLSGQFCAPVGSADQALQAYKQLWQRYN